MQSAKDIRLIVTDIDSTILPWGKDRVSERTRKDLSRAVSRGISLMIDTGRSYSFIPESLFEDLPMQYIGTINGACLCTRDGKVLESYSMSDASRKALTAFCEVHRYGLGFKFTDAIVTYCCHDTFIEGYCSENPYLASRVKNDDLQQSHHLSAGNPSGAFIIGDKKTIESFVSEIRELRCAWSAKRGCDVYLADQNKATIVEPVMKRMGITWDNVIAFGDAGNDSPLLKHAGIGVAVGEGRDDILQYADVVAERAENDGVARTLEALGFA